MSLHQLPHGKEVIPANLQAFTVEQVAEMLHVGRDKVYYLLRTGQLRSIKIGKLRRITEQHLTEFIASLEDHAKLQGRSTSHASGRPFGNELPNGLLLYG
jgi:excisionase family DNA binding protein